MTKKKTGKAISLTQYRFFRLLISMLVLGVTAAITWYATTNIGGSYELAAEDGVIENASAIFLWIAAVISLLSTVAFASHKKFLPALFTLLCAMVFFSLGMEEISWMQRLLGTESSAFFKEYNLQGETNLHNLDSHLANQLYYCAGFMLLVVLPFLYEDLQKFTRSKMSWLQPLLPSDWFLPIFAPAFSLLLPMALGKFSIISLQYVIFFMSIAILLFEVARHVHSRRFLMVAVYFVSLMLSAMALSLSSIDGFYTIRLNIPQEYKEFLIGIGILIYTADIYARNFIVVPDRKRTKRSPKK